MKISLILILLYSCSSQTIIKTQEDVKIYIDGDFKSRGSYVMEDNKVVFSKTDVILKKEGCLDKNYIIRKNEKINYRSLFISFLALPVLWLLEYEQERFYQFECSKI